MDSLLVLVLTYSPVRPLRAGKNRAMHEPFVCCSSEPHRPRRGFVGSRLSSTFFARAESRGNFRPVSSFGTPAAVGQRSRQERLPGAHPVLRFEHRQHVGWRRSTPAVHARAV